MAAAPPGWRQNSDGSWMYQAADGNWYPQQAPPPPVVVGPQPGAPVTLTTRARTKATFLSFAGVTRRAASWLRGKPDSHWAIRFFLLWPLVAIYLFLMWAVILMWYCCVVVPFFFIVLPWRAMRRGQRGKRHLQEAQLAALQQIAQQPRQ